ncbi:peptidase inhibitor family I36 protein [Streptomyces prunicolor]|uniref:Peptidase inhibitor family I36 protein n=1 Tax=Streptomyces prunicolor TaxID=67348 RepID=A0ABU4F594_9ACTN|nr:peptidase inhibitor family I36 protein [Streptomyces prunicolor]MDV7215755.1 peptidase inhibitor family I36 protein [Streptomyces prunicolor]
MRIRMSLAVAMAATCLALTGAASPSQARTAATATSATQAASAAAQRADENCGAGEICFWHDRNYSGTPWRWSPASGYRDMPSNLHDHVYSFKANANACFIDWSPQEKRPVVSGDYAQAYDTNFGKRIDAVGPTC